MVEGNCTSTRSGEELGEIAYRLDLRGQSSNLDKTEETVVMGFGILISLSTREH